MLSLLALIIEAIKVAAPPAIEIYTIIHDRQTGKITLLTQLDLNSTSLQGNIQELISLKAKLAAPLIA